MLLKGGFVKNMMEDFLEEESLMFKACFRQVHNKRMSRSLSLIKDQKGKFYDKCFKYNGSKSLLAISVTLFVSSALQVKQILK